MKNVKIVALSFELLMGFLLQHDDHVASFDAGLLVAFAAEEYLLAVLHPLVDVHL